MGFFLKVFNIFRSPKKYALLVSFLALTTTLDLSHAAPISNQTTESAEQAKKGRDVQGTVVDAYRETEWSINDGAPAAIAAIIQTHDGYIWLGADSGLYRFNGNQFTRFDQIASPGEKLLSQNIRALTVAPDGSLWIGYGKGGISILRSGHLIHLYAGEGLPDLETSAIAFQGATRAWIGTANGIYLMNEGRVSRLANDWNAGEGLVRKILVDAKDNVWLYIGASLRVLTPGSKRFEEVQIPDTPKGAAIMDVALTPEGRPWVNLASRLTTLSLGMGPVPASNEKWTPDLVGEWNLTDFAPAPCVIDQHHVVWGTGVSPFVAPQVKRSADSSENVGQLINFTANFGVCLLDREGSVWLAGADGLRRYHRLAVTKVIASSELPRPFTRGDVPGTILVARKDGSVDTYPQLNAPVPSAPKLLARNVASALAGSDQNFWIGGFGLLFHRFMGKTIPIPMPEEIPAYPLQTPMESSIASLAVDAGDLWMSTLKEGLFRFSNGRWARESNTHGLPNIGSSVINVAPDGSVWVGLRDGRVFVRRRHSGEFSAVFNLSIGQPAVITYGPRGTWIGGETGVVLIDDQGTHPIGAAEQKELWGVTGIADGKNGELWLNSVAGLVNLDFSSVAMSVAKPGTYASAKVFDHDDGVSGSAMLGRAGPSLLETTDGKIWFRRGNSIFSYVPSIAPNNPVPPPVFITSLLADGKLYEHIRPVQLPSLTRSVRIAFEVMSLAIPERVQVRYFLEGQETNWREAGSARQVDYTNLPPGKYRFRLMGANDSGVWNTQEAVVDFRVAPAFWQTPWFSVLCVLALAALAWAWQRWRVRRSEAETTARLEGRHAERLRIARDLHDTLLQESQGMIYQVQATSTKIARVDQALAGELDRVLDVVSKVVAQARDQVHELRVNDRAGENSLAHTLRGVIREIFGESSSVVTITEAGKVPELPPDMFAQVIAIAREALVNAFQHADASDIELMIEGGFRRVRLVVKDNGCGIPPQFLKAGQKLNHWGLPGMRERADEIGARLEISSPSGRGTTVQLVLRQTLSRQLRRLFQRWR